MKDELDNILVKKLSKSSSGVNVITILTSPYPEVKNKWRNKVQQFSCGKNCAYCPKEPKLKIKCSVISKKVIELNTKNEYIKIELKSKDNIDNFRVVTWIECNNNKNIPVFKLYNYDCNKKRITILVDLKYKKKILNEKELILVKNEQPRSYISTEPAVQRGNRYNFDAVGQFYDRAYSLLNCGHLVDKIELLVLGGTWSHYPKYYRNNFIRDIYYAANTFYDKKRNRMDLQFEKDFNENKSQCKIIGLTLETRPDCINIKEIKSLREYGCTRVQLGIQHIDDRILEKINRGCKNRDHKKAMYLLKQNGYKVDIHLMPDLYGSNFLKDKKMFDTLLGIESVKTINKNYMEYKLRYPFIQADQWKIYPTEVTKWTKIYELYKKGEYKPYAEIINNDTGNKYIEDLLLNVKRKVFPWIRLNRIIRDIPSHEIFGGNNNPSLRQKLQKKLKEMGYKCNCIRCKEIKN